MNEVRTIEVASPPNLYPGYVYFSLRALIPGSTAPCTVRLETLNPSSEELQLFSVLAPGQPVHGAWLKAILNEGVEQGYVSADDLDALQQYLHQTTRAAIEEGTLDPQARHHLVYENALCSIKAAILDPNNGRRLSMGVATVRHMIDYLWDDDTARSGMLTVMARDRQLFSHSLNVCLLGVGFARTERWPREEVDALGIALFFHDLGLAGIWEKMSAGSGNSITEEDRYAIREHPNTSRKFLRGLDGLSPSALEIVRNHHENLDGSGFPRGLHGDQLSNSARLARITDCYDSLTSGNFAHARQTPFTSLKTMRVNMCNHLDQVMLESFVRFLGKN